jgi:hypothetical protein
MHHQRTKIAPFVPQFDLKRFADIAGRLWVWDKRSDRIFVTNSAGVAGETKFYYHAALEALGHDPLRMEKQFSELEGSAAAITSTWLDQIRDGSAGQSLGISDDERSTIALFLALQFLRTTDMRDQIARFADSSDAEAPVLTPAEAQQVHLDILWDEKTVNAPATRISGLAWTFAKNPSPVPLVTSDNPVTFKTGDNRMWLKVGISEPETYLTFALAPDVAMYGYPDEGRYRSLYKFDGQISPVELSVEMVDGDNTAHLFMASRHIVSPSPDFAWAREFAEAVADGRFAPSLK